MTKEALEILLEKYEKGSCTPEEMAFMDALLDRYAATKDSILSPGEEQEVLEVLQMVRGRIKQRTEIEWNSEIETDLGKNRKLDTDEDKNNFFSAFGKVDKPVRFSRRSGYWLAAAAAILVLFVGVYWFFQRHTDTSVHRVAQSANRIRPVRPGTTSASLILSNGQRIGFDSSHSQTISAIQVGKGAVSLMKKSGQRVYLSKTAALGVYNTLVTARGQQAPEMTLSDGTKVWLNAASRLHFPVQFSGATREVTLSGEAYFEVAKDTDHPFIVKTGKSRIKVLGTHFNVMAYHDEPNTYATLLEGAIQIENDQGHAKLIPGQQAVIGRLGDIRVENVDTKLSVAWLHGKLPMDNMDVQAFLREVSRWYDVDINYLETVPSQTFSGNLNRQVPLKNILSALKANGINAKLKNRTIIVSNG